MSRYEKPFDLMVLDCSYNLIGLVVYNKLQWNRKCLEPGVFSIELTGEQYKNNWCYIYSPDRRELGRISQVNLNYSNGSVSVNISGYFIEADLNQMIVYPKPSQFWSSSNPHTSITSDNPNWLSQSGTADQVALAFFNGFKSITYKGYDIEDTTGTNLKTREYTLDIQNGIIEIGNYHQSEHQRNGEYLGNKISEILKPSHAFYQVNYNYQTNTKTFDIKIGKDLTNDNIDGNNPVVFSTTNGTIATAGIVKSNTSTKDIALAYSQSDEKTEVLVNGYDEALGRFLALSNLPSDSDYSTDLAYKLAALKESANELINSQDKLNISFKVFDGSYEYMIDFDLGDIVSIEIPEIDLSVEAQIIGCYETVQNGVWNLDIEFGTPLRR